MAITFPLIVEPVVCGYCQITINEDNEMLDILQAKAIQKQ
jgi:hypothetical protein